MEERIGLLLAVLISNSPPPPPSAFPEIEDAKSAPASSALEVEGFSSTICLPAARVLEVHS